MEFWEGLISIVLSVINSGPHNYDGIDKIPVCTGSTMYMLHYTSFYVFLIEELICATSLMINGHF